MSKKIVSTDQAPKAIGPYSQGTIFDGRKLVFTSGQIAIDPATGSLVPGGIAEQTHRTLKNVAAVLAAAGSALDHVLKTTVYLQNLDDFKAMNEVYQQYFTGDNPARATVQISRLPLNALVEIDAIGYCD